MQSRNSPRISVLMAVYNGQRYLRESIESILKQSFDDFEFIIVNDGSTDSSRDIILSLNDPRILFVENAENEGLAKSLNRGVSLARGEYIARQDADDISDHQRFEKQVTYLEGNPSVAVLGTQTNFVNESGRPFRAPLWVRPCEEAAIRWVCMFESPFAHSSVMMRADAVRYVGGYDPNLRIVEDHEFWARIVYDHSCRNLPDELINLRVHDGSMGHRYEFPNLEPFISAIKRACEQALPGRDSSSWAESWVRINNACLFSKDLDLGNIAQSIESMHEVFVSRYGNSDEVEFHKNRLLLRAAYHAASFARIASLRLFVRTAKHDLKIVRSVFLKYTIIFLFGRRLSRNVKVFGQRLWKWVSRDGLRRTAFES